MGIGEFKQKLRTRLFRRPSANNQSPDSPAFPSEKLTGPSTTVHPAAPQLHDPHSPCGSVQKPAHNPEPDPEAANEPDSSIRQPPSSIHGKAIIINAHPAESDVQSVHLPLHTAKQDFFATHHKPAEPTTPQASTSDGNGTIDRPQSSGGASAKSGDVNTLDSSAWILPDLPPSADERPQIRLVGPTPQTSEQEPATLARIAEAARASPGHSDKTNNPPPDKATAIPTTPHTAAAMVPRKIWVKRANAAATLVMVREDQLVDEIKDAVLRKYANSLGRHYDAPDVTLRIVPRDHTEDFALVADELLVRAIDKHFPGGQSIDEALLISVPQRRHTPKQSPGLHASHQLHPGVYYHPAEDTRPNESGTDYFPPMPPIATSPGGSNHLEPRAMSVLTTGQVPPLTSPGGRRNHAGRSSRPAFPRTQTGSPIAVTNTTGGRVNRPRVDSVASEKQTLQAANARVPTPPAVEAVKNVPKPPSPRVASPRPGKSKKLRTKQASPPELGPATMAPSIVDTSVPPINVLIVEDNMINMRLLEQFVRKLKVHWATAVNGREAVQKWRQGGFHLVLMDIQLPIMSGLDATREIRRLERANHIGVLTGSNHSNVPPTLSGEGEMEEAGVTNAEDVLKDTAKLFKSPVIIVALTASNLNSDRHEALAAGCNDFLTKPVNFVWFERKVKEWGCMQALIDYAGWRKWEEHAIQNGLKNASNPRPGSVKKPRPEKIGKMAAGKAPKMEIKAA
jgi:osomolarity two-component system response regulator SSK1